MTLQRREPQPTVEVSGLVADAVRYTADDLGRLAAEHRPAGELGPNFAGTAVAVERLLAPAAPAPEADHCTVESDDGHYRASIPLAEVAGKGWLIYTLDGEALPRKRGGPFRLVVLDGATLCWNVKGVVRLRCTEGREADSVPANPPH